MKQIYSKEEVILEASNINLKYGEKVILNNVNLRIHNIVRPDILQGQVVSLIGRSGIGKTQLFKVLAGLIKPTSGEVKIDVDQHPVIAGEMGIIPQNYILFDHRTIRKNLLIGLDHCEQKLTDKEKDDIINDYADKFNLTEHLNKYPKQLSGGQKQRVSIIQQVLTGNKFILLDEPFSGLDILMIDKVINLLLRVSNFNELNTLILVSHDIENSLAISDTAYILAKHPQEEGATITELIDLVELGFAWEKDIKMDKNFQVLVNDIKNRI